MKSNRSSPMPEHSGFSRSISGPLSVVEIQRGDLKEFFLTFRPKKLPSGVTESVEEIYDRVAEYISSIRGEVVQERCYAMTNTYEAVSAARRKAFKRHGVQSEGPLCFVGEMPCEPTSVAGIQVWAVQSKKSAAVCQLLLEGQAVGRTFCYQNICYLSVASLGPRGDLQGVPRRQEHAVSMFEQANQILTAHGLSYRNVARTWIYLPKLLSWYDEFNAGRRQAYRKFGLLDGEKPVWLPASTGIQGDCPLGRECMMDFLAISRLEGGTLETETLDSPAQCEASQYGSSFSRGVEVRDESVSRVYVSGTASIDDEGKTVHIGDPEKQIRHTLNVVRELLASRNHSFSDVAHCVAFFKRPEYSTHFRRIAEEEGLDYHGVIETAADICRDDLLFEVEVMTIKPLGKS